MAQPGSVAVPILVTPKNPNGSSYIVKQVSAESGLAKAAPVLKQGPVEPNERQNIDVNFGPVQFVGYLQRDTYDMAYTVTVFGINLGTFYGNLLRGLSIELDLAVGKGKIKLYMKSGNSIWVRLDLTPKVGDGAHGDYKTASI